MQGISRKEDGTQKDKHSPKHNSNNEGSNTVRGRYMVNLNIPTQEQQSKSQTQNISLKTKLN